MKTRMKIGPHFEFEAEGSETFVNDCFWMTMNFAFPCTRQLPVWECGGGI